MGHGKGLPESVNAYLRDQIEAWLVAAEGRTAAELARLLGVSPAHVSNLRKHGRGAGYSTEEGMARILGVSVDELRRRAEESWSKNRPVELHREDRYPNRRRAVDFMGDLVHPEAVRRAAHRRGVRGAAGAGHTEQGPPARPARAAPRQRGPLPHRARARDGAAGASGAAWNRAESLRREAGSMTAVIR